MFGIRMPLFEEENGASGGGGPAITNPVGDIMDVLYGVKQAPYETGMTEGEAAKVNTAVDAEDAHADEVLPDPIMPQGGGTPLSRIAPPIDLGVGPKNKAWIHTKGEAAMGLTHSQQAHAALLEKQQQNYEKAQILSQMKANRALAQTLAATSELYEQDYKTARMVNDQYYSRAERVNRQLREDVDAVRELSFDDERFRKALGPAGRMTSALSVGLAQLASGAGNANSVAQRIDAAVERDIANQKAELAFRVAQVDATKKLSEADRQLLEDFHLYEEKARVLFNHAVAAEAGRIKLRMDNEMLFQATQMIENRYQSAALAATAARNAKAVSMFYDKPAATVAEWRRQQKQIQALLGAFEQEFNDQQGGPPPQFDPGIQMAPGGPVIGGQPVNDGSVQTAVEQASAEGEAKQAAQAAQMAQPRAVERARSKKPRTSAMAPASGGQVTDTLPAETPSEAPVTTSAKPAQMQFDANGNMVAFDATEAPEPAPEPAPAEPAKEEVLRTRSGYPEPKTPEEFKYLAVSGGMPEQIYDRGGHTYAELDARARRDAKAGKYTFFDPKIRPFEESVKKFLNPAVTDKRLFNDEFDALVALEQYDTRPETAKTRYQKKHPETLVTPYDERPKLGQPDIIESNIIDLGGDMGVLYLRRNSPFRVINNDIKLNDKGKSNDPRTRMKAELADHYESMATFARAAELADKGGIGGTGFDMFTINADGEFKTTFFGNGVADDIRNGKAASLQMAYAFLNNVDEGRKSDFDMKIGADVMTAMLEGETFQRVMVNIKLKAMKMFDLTSDEAENEIVASQRRFILAMAYANAEKFAAKLMGTRDVILSYEQHELLANKRLQAERAYRKAPTTLK